jgi:concanavalin A-like lectin/glucanase superfamily protein
MARNFNGTTQWGEAAANAAWEPTGAITVSCWAKRPTGAQNDWAVILHYKNTGAGTDFSWAAQQLSADEGDLTYQINVGGVGQDVFPATAVMTADVWHHLCFTFNGTTFIPYHDGTSYPSETHAGSIAYDGTGGLGVGATHTGHAAPWKGDIAELAVWDVALSAGQVTALAGGDNPFTVQASDLQAYVPLYGNASPEEDLIGSNDITITGATQSTHPPVDSPPSESHSGTALLHGGGAHVGVVRKQAIATRTSL